MTWYYNIADDASSMDIIDGYDTIITTVNNDGSGFTIPTGIKSIMRSEAEKAEQNGDLERWREIHIQIADDDIGDNETRQATPKLSLSTPDTIPNDGSAKTVTIETDADSEQTATLRIDDLTEQIIVQPDSPYTQDIATTVSAGTVIEVSVNNMDLRGDRAEIEVVSA